MKSQRRMKGENIIEYFDEASLFLTYEKENHKKTSEDDSTTKEFADTATCFHSWGCDKNYDENWIILADWQTKFFIIPSKSRTVKHRTAGFRT